MINFRTPVLWAIALAPFSTLRGADATSQSAVSYTRDVLPIFRSECQGCHQPAKQKGDYVMTDFASLLAGGESGDPAIIPGHPEESYLIELITPVDGASEMPPKDGPLPEDQVAMITRWVAEGAVDDSPPRTAPKVDAGNPPVYSQLPVVTSLDFSPDGKWLAVAGYHEVLLHKSDGSEIVHRLVGLSERVESVRFSPDGKRLAVAGGDPGRSGELQIWDVEKRSLLLSKAVTYDTIYGASWSPDGTRIAVGCAHDKSVRAFDAKTGAQILFMGGHDDWPLATVWSKEGTHVVSGGRDMTTKLTEVESERFIDNITSITPKALKGGIHSLARQPENDFFLVGGADGEPKIYRAFREVERKIGDDSNLIRRYPSLPGRLFSVAFAPDGKTFVAAASLDGKGTLTVCSSEFDATIPDEIKKIWKKTILQRSDEEKEKYESWW
ncbi:MAG: c-type cytochrome domain-containing protein, partial [Verrucomicrobiota bacterium]